VFLLAGAVALAFVPARPSAPRAEV
jgi:hypothetical protein